MLNAQCTAFNEGHAAASRQSVYKSLAKLLKPPFPPTFPRLSVNVSANTMPFNRETPSPFLHSNVEVVGLFRAPTVSSIDTDATADDLPGAGRTIGRLLGSLGSKLENFMNKRAERAGLGPKAIANEICRLARHRQICIEETNSRPRWCLPVAPGRRFNKSETKALRKLSQKLIAHARSHVESNQLIALKEIIELSINDPRIRAIFARFDLEQLITHYNEPDLLLMTQRALGAIEFSNIHCIWAPLLSLRPILELRIHHTYQILNVEDSKISSIREDILETFRNPSTSFLSARYFSSLVGILRSRKMSFKWAKFDELVEDIMNLYVAVAIREFASVELSTFQSCMLYRDLPGSLITKLSSNLDL
ncbi:hypothetical protein SCHPADRAFT_942964 [Schizopora paradoxa]|uniref:Uncharacterized protein n=1 Tax=Schizopora paradoxa TaxID=27342 RepID=A0A0H2RFF0_9AGAM|nr:hypothetical protein SCHPADRAFT_942964 [Schizopora paradoxa]